MSDMTMFKFGTTPVTGRSFLVSSDDALILAPAIKQARPGNMQLSWRSSEQHYCF